MNDETKVCFVSGFFVGTSRIFCRYICFNFTLPPHFQMSGYATDLLLLHQGALASFHEETVATGTSVCRFATNLVLRKVVSFFKPCQPNRARGFEVSVA